MSSPLDQLHIVRQPAGIQRSTDRLEGLMGGWTQWTQPEPLDVTTEMTCSWSL